jgi:phospholipid/cholesterol/gamma-HCH transport system permease protein
LGAEVFVVDLVAISILRELGVLLTAIVIAGRSGSSFTAEIGTMKVNEEIDAMSVLGMSPVDVLVVPRFIALVVSLPLLTFLADMMGLFGGGVYSWVALDISPSTFVERVREGVAISNFWVGFVKAPAFAALIALVGCYEGMAVTGSAESVGRRTTRSVVESIFLVIVVDALFSIMFGVMGV